MFKIFKVAIKHIFTISHTTHEEGAGINPFAYHEDEYTQTCKLIQLFSIEPFVFHFH